MVIPRVNRKKVVIIGHGRAGKDSVALILNRNYGFTYKSSSEAALELFMLEELKEYGLYYDSVQDAMNDRFDHRSLWHQLITEYNEDIKTRLAREIMRSNEVYVGMRSPEELEECLADGVFDLVIAVTREGVEEEPGSSNRIDPLKYAHFVIPNNGTIQDLEDEVDQIAPYLFHV